MSSNRARGRRLFRSGGSWLPNSGWGTAGQQASDGREGRVERWLQAVRQVARQLTGEGYHGAEGRPCGQLVTGAYCRAAFKLLGDHGLFP